MTNLKIEDRPTPECDAAQKNGFVHVSVAHRIERERDCAVEALKDIAALKDDSAQNVLEIHGTYSAFDEPHSVKTAREALAEIERSRSKHG